MSDAPPKKIVKGKSEKDDIHPTRVTRHSLLAGFTPDKTTDNGQRPRFTARIERERRGQGCFGGQS
jgi:hypothetical protein